MIKRAFQILPGDMIPGIGTVTETEQVGQMILVKFAEYPLETSFRRNALVSLALSSQRQDS